MSERWMWKQSTPCELSGMDENLDCCDDCGCDPRLIFGEIVSGPDAREKYGVVAVDVDMKDGQYICDLHNNAIAGKSP